MGSLRRDDRLASASGWGWVTATTIFLALLVATSTVGAAEPSDAAVRVSVVELDRAVRAGQHWRIETERGAVHVWTPDGYDADTAATVVFVHGYHTDVDRAWDGLRLPHQFVLSGLNAMFIAAEAPSGKRAPIVWPSINALIASVAVRLGVRIPTGRMVAVGHSGAYRTLAEWLTSRQLDTVVLLDAVYGEYRFLPWVQASRTHRLVNIANETIRFCDVMHRALPATHRVDELPDEGLPDARIVYAKTKVGHWQLVTDGVALPMALRAIGGTMLPAARLPLGLAELGGGPSVRTVGAL